MVAVLAGLPEGGVYLPAPLPARSLWKRLRTSALAVGALENPLTARRGSVPTIIR